MQVGFNDFIDEAFQAFSSACQEFSFSGYNHSKLIRVDIPGELVPTFENSLHQEYFTDLNDSSSS